MSKWGCGSWRRRIGGKKGEATISHRVFGLDRFGKWMGSFPGAGPLDG